MAWILLSTILMSLAGLVAYLYFFEDGQFDEPEDVKFQMFRQENESALLQKPLQEPREAGKK